MADVEIWKLDKFPALVEVCKFVDEKKGFIEAKGPVTTEPPLDMTCELDDIAAD